MITALICNDNYWRWLLLIFMLIKTEAITWASCRLIRSETLGAGILIPLGRGSSPRIIELCILSRSWASLGGYRSLSVIIGHYLDMIGHYRSLSVITGHYLDIIGHYRSLSVITGHYLDMIGHYRSLSVIILTWSVIIGHYRSLSVIILNSLSVIFSLLVN